LLPFRKKNFYFPVAFIALGLFLCLFVWHDYTSPNSLTQETTVVLPRGAGFSKSIDLLAENEVIKHPLFIKTIAYVSGNAKKIKAGEYLFAAEITPQEALQMLVQGWTVKHKFTITEGLNVREVAELLRDESLLSGNVPENIEEGSLLPETYYFARGDSRTSLIERMQEQMQKTITDLWEQREDGLPLTDLKQALVLASIVEKETGVPEERARVAGVFINRLKIGMKLQSDPTTAYGIEQETGKKLGRQLNGNDLRTPTRYNTYTIETLPPTPICNFGQAALEAVLHPLKTNELYFVATGKGGHYFASTLAEHERNVRLYRQTIANEHGQ